MAINVAGGGPSPLPTINLWGNQTGTPGYGINSGLVLSIADPLAYDFFIYQQPTNQTIPLGGNGVVSIGAGGAPINYQWWFNGTNLFGATNSFYQITNMGPQNVGDYSVVLANIINTQTSAVAHITIRLAPSISQQPTNGQAFPVGTTTSLSVVAAGTDPLSYQWRSTAGSATLGTDPTLSFPLAQTNNSGSYFVIITNFSGAVTSPPASLAIYQPAAIVTPPSGLTLPNGASATFNVAAGGFPTLNYQWMLNGTNIAGATATGLTINAIHLKDLGNYTVLVSNAYSSVQSIAATLSMSPSITTPFVGVAGLWGQGAVLNVGAIGSGTLVYQWFKDGVAISGATNSTYNISTLQLTDAGQYSVSVSSGFGSVTNIPAQVIVNPAEVTLGIYAGVVIQGTVGYSYDIQYSTDLTDTNAWIDATNITLQQSIQIWSDYGSDVRANPKRYYRVKALP
ncbi:MAG: immunoglobulin domain-containing protein [Verrucomicrobia bacterium]|nr:immunoglobulin domain-containing protein [Verrucomicrobiota bacterium]